MTQIFRSLHRIYAFFRRDAINVSSYKLNFTFSIVSMFTWMLTVGTLGYVTQSAQAPYMEEYGNMTAATFIIIAVISEQFLGMSQFAPQFIASPGAMERILLTPCSIPVFILGSMVWRYFWSILNLIVGITVGTALFGMMLPIDPIAVFLVLIVGIIPMWGLGIISAAIQLVTKQWNPLNWFIGNFSWLVSGTFYSRQALLAFDPTGILYAIGWAFPHTYVYDMVRRAWVGASILDLWPSFVSLLIMAVVFFGLGWLTFKLCLRRCQLEGSLGWV